MRPSGSRRWPDTRQAPPTLRPNDGPSGQRSLVPTFNSCAEQKHASQCVAAVGGLALKCQVHGAQIKVGIDDLYSQFVGAGCQFTRQREYVPKDEWSLSRWQHRLQIDL